MTDIRHHILFDLDGTLTDPGEGITGSVRHAMQTLGYPVPDQKTLERFIGPPLDEEFRAVCGFDDGQTAAAILAFREYFAETGIHQNALFPGMDTLLQNLKKSGRTLHIATTKPVHFANQIIVDFGIAPYFDQVCGSDLAHPGRQKADVVAEVLQRGGVAPADAVMVGDRKHDVIGAGAHGIPCVGVLFGYGGAQELTEAGAAALAADVDELERLLLRY